MYTHIAVGVAFFLQYRPIDIKVCDGSGGA